MGRASALEYGDIMKDKTGVLEDEKYCKCGCVVRYKYHAAAQYSSTVRVRYPLNRSTLQATE